LHRGERGRRGRRARELADALKLVDHARDEHDAALARDLLGLVELRLAATPRDADLRLRPELVVHVANHVLDVPVVVVVGVVARGVGAIGVRLALDGGDRRCRPRHHLRAPDGEASVRHPGVVVHELGDARGEQLDVRLAPLNVAVDHRDVRRRVAVLLLHVVHVVLAQAEGVERGAQHTVNGHVLLDARDDIGAGGEHLLLVLGALLRKLLVAHVAQVERRRRRRRRGGRRRCGGRGAWVTGRGRQQPGAAREEPRHESLPLLRNLHVLVAAQGRRILLVAAREVVVAHLELAPILLGHHGVVALNQLNPPLDAAPHLFDVLALRDLLQELRRDVVHCV
jgi:hypothetical protein